MIFFRLASGKEAGQARSYPVHAFWRISVSSPFRNLDKVAMKIYQVVRRGNQWHVHMQDSSRGVCASEDKSRIVDWACDEARRVDGQVQVRDVGGKIEAVYTYVDGVEQQKPSA
jgi:hypothetical protein